MPNSKIKILFFLFGGCGGAERMTLNIAKGMPKERFDVQFVVCGKLKDIYQFIPDGYKVTTIPWHNIHVFPRTRIARVMMKEKPDYAFSSTMGLNLLVLQVAKWFGIKVVVRNDNFIRIISSSALKTMRKRYKYASYVIAQQDEMRDELINEVELNPNKVVTLHNPIDTISINERINAPNPFETKGCINYLWVGNYLPTKGHDILAEAFKLVHACNPNSHLYFVGNIVESFPNYIKTKSIVNEANLQEYVHFVGQQSNPYKWMKYCDCFVLPSRLEGLPNVLLEAMYLRKPVVASVCVPVIDRIIEEGYNGYKVKPEDPEAMAVAMGKAIMLKDFGPTFKSATAEDFNLLFS